MIKVGTELWCASIVEPSGAFEWQTWVVRSIRKGKIAATIKTSWTWGKVSKHHGDFGWLDPVPSYARVTWYADAMPLWVGLATTKLAALRLALKLQKSSGADEDYTGITNAQIVAKLETMIKRNRGKK